MKKIILIGLVLLLCIGMVSGARLPTVGGDGNTWGNILNDFLLTEHTINGSHKNMTVDGYLNITGDIITAGEIDGRVISVDGAKLDTITNIGSGLIVTGAERINWDNAFGWGDHLGLYDLIGSAATAQANAEAYAISNDTVLDTRITTLETDTALDYDELSDLSLTIMLEGENVGLLANDAGYLTLSTLPDLPSTIMEEGENVGLLANDAGYLTSYTETDPTVDLAKLKTLVSDDFHSLGGTDANTPQLSQAEIEAMGFDDTSNGIAISSQVPQAFKAEYSIDTQQGVWVHGVKVELTRTANIQPATGTWFGGQFVLNAGSSGFSVLDKPAYALQAIFKGSDVDPEGVSGDVHVARFETQGDAKVSDILYITANSGTSIQGSGIYIANHGTMPNAIQINGAGGSLTNGIDMLGTIDDYGIDMGAATIGKADIRLSSGAKIMSGLLASIPGTCAVGDMYLATDGALLTTLNICTAINTWTGK